MGGGWYFIIHLSDWLIKNIAACHNVSHFPYFLVIMNIWYVSHFPYFLVIMNIYFTPSLFSGHREHIFHIFPIFWSSWRYISHFPYFLVIMNICFTSSLFSGHHEHMFHIFPIFWSLWTYVSHFPYFLVTINICFTFSLFSGHYKHMLLSVIWLTACVRKICTKKATSIYVHVYGFMATNYIHQHLPL